MKFYGLEVVGFVVLLLDQKRGKARAAAWCWRCFRLSVSVLVHCNGLWIDAGIDPSGHDGKRNDSNQ